MLDVPDATCRVITRRALRAAMPRSRCRRLRQRARAMLRPTRCCHVICQICQRTLNKARHTRADAARYHAADG